MPMRASRGPGTLASGRREREIERQTNRRTDATQACRLHAQGPCCTSSGEGSGGRRLRPRGMYLRAARGSTKHR
eukprot:9081565-Alexandrium_andersonii.AAC.1